MLDRIEQASGPYVGSEPDIVKLRQIGVGVGIGVGIAIERPTPIPIPTPIYLMISLSPDILVVVHMPKGDQTR
jgi:hypothetical protein